MRSVGIEAKSKLPPVAEIPHALGEKKERISANYNGCPKSLIVVVKLRECI
ncbi:hypothetical protein Plhal304r1_c007g0029431 [Plasmopara halstedii]